MELEYNEVPLEMLSLDKVERVSVYSRDNMDLLYIRIMLAATCIYSPNGYPVGTSVTQISPKTSDALYGQASLSAGSSMRGKPPEFGPLSLQNNISGGQAANRHGLYTGGFNAAMTDAELYNRLMTPRKRLVIRAYDDTGKRITWLESPRPGNPVDAAGGPFPIACSVLENHGGGNTFGVHFQIHTYLVPVNDEADRLVLSHRWEMVHSNDENFYLSRVIQGEIVFNAGVVQRLGIQPDLVRNQFIHPIPLGFRRNAPVVRASSDGLTIAYTVTDVDPTVTFDPGNSGATNIQIAEKLGYESPWGL